MRQRYTEKTAPDGVWTDKRGEKPKYVDGVNCGLCLVSYDSGPFVCGLCSALCVGPCTACVSRCEACVFSCIGRVCSCTRKLCGVCMSCLGCCATVAKCGCIGAIIKCVCSPIKAGCQAFKKRAVDTCCAPCRSKCPACTACMLNPTFGTCTACVGRDDRTRGSMRVTTPT